MKHKKSFLKKFHRKYIFLQNSLSDFLYWRTSNSLQENESLFKTSKKNILQNKSIVLEQDKICLQQYWKSSENKKIKNAIQNINTKLNLSNDLDFDQKSNQEKLKKLSSSLKVEFSTSQKYSSSTEFLKNTKQKSNEHRYKTLNSPRFQKKFRKLLFSTGKNSSENSNLPFGRKQILIPESDCFRQFDRFPFFPFVQQVNQKFGQFFPKKKNFQQYWIFPLLGFVVFFSSPSLSLQKKTFSEFQNKIYLFKNTKDKNFSVHFLNKNTAQNSVQKMMNFSYSENFSKETYEQIQKFEKNEFQMFCDFYLTFFQNSMTKFLISEKENRIVPFGQQATSIVNCVEKNNLRKIFEINRNVLNWKWFSLNSPFLTFDQSNKFYNFCLAFFNETQKSSFEIPQKAQFFFCLSAKGKNEESFFPNIQNSNNQNKFSSKTALGHYQKTVLDLTPVLEFSKASFLLNEFERNQYFESFLPNSENFVFKNSEIQKQNPILLNVETFDQQAKHFLRNLKKEDLKFLNSVSEQKTLLKNQNKNDFHFLPVSQMQKNSVLDMNNIQFFPFGCLCLGTNGPTDQPKATGQQVEKNVNFDSKNFFFLQKWLQTQNFWQVQKKYSNEKISEQLIEVSSLLPTVKKSVQQNFSFGNLMNLDSLYIQKLFQSKNQQCLNTNIKNTIPFSNSSQLVEFTQNKEMFKTSLFENKKNVFTKDQRFQKKTNEKFAFCLKLKKQTFEFFLFQHYNTHSKNFFKKSLLKKNSFLLSPIFSKLKENQKNLELFKKTSFLNDFLMKQSFASWPNANDFNSLENSNRISQLEIPIFLDFSKKNSLLSDKGENTFFSLKNKNNENQENFLAYVQNQKSRFFNLPVKFSYHNSLENLESRPSTLSSNYFHLGNIQKFIPTFSFDTLSSENSSYNPRNTVFFNKVDFFGNRTDQTKNSLKSTFSCSKNDFFETIIENTFKNLKTTIYAFEFFKKSFFVEKSKKEQPFVLQTSEGFGSKSKPKSTEKVQSFFVKYSKSFVLKPFSQNEKQMQKKHYVFLNQSKNNVETYFKTYNKDFYLWPQSNFQARKFEKIFKTFLSSLNKEKNENLFFAFGQQASFLPLVKKGQQEKNDGTQTVKKSKKFKILSKVKKMNDSLFLEALSNSLKKELKTTNSIFFISSAKNKDENLNTSFAFGQEAKNNLTIESNKILSQTLPLEKKHNKKAFNNESSLFLPLLDRQNTPKKSSIYPTILLKRDGFIGVPKFNKMSDLKMEKLFTKNQKLVQNNHYLLQISQKHTNNLTISRLEKEKALQKKRRIKKQKLETRRRKKRKRFFPRPLWLRFHLYKKFLKIRHPQKFISQSSTFSSNSNKEGSFVSNKESFSLFQQNLTVHQTKNLPVAGGQQEKVKTVSFLYPKLKYQSFASLPNANFSKEDFFENSSFEKRWTNAFSSVSSQIMKNRFAFDQKQRNLFSFQQFFESNKAIQSPHFSLKKFSLQKLQEKNLLSSAKSNNQNQFEQMNIHHRNRQKWGFYWQNGFQEKIFYKKFPLSKSFNQKTNNRSENSPISQNREHYKISGEILSEFLRLSWKSYWFQMNFIPYTRKITQNFRKMQQIESQKNFSDFNLLSIFGNLQYPSVLNGHTPILFSNAQQYSQNDLILKKSVFKKFLWYCNIQNSLESKTIVDPEFMNGTQLCLNFQKIQNAPEYNRILYTRVSEILKNFKSAETNDDTFSQRSQKMLKIPKRKNENFSPNSSFFTKCALFSENFTVPSRPSIPAFSIFSSLFNDSSIKPTGEIPTLRALWALHQTNFYHFQEKNAVRNLWTLKKRTDSLKSLKATKKAIHSFRKYSGLEKLNAPTLFKSFGLNQLDQTQLLQEQQKNAFFPERLQTNKLLVLSTLNSGFKDFVQQLDSLSVQKFINVQQKCDIFGIKTFEQNSKISLRYLKFHLFSKNQKQNFAFSKSVGSQSKATDLLKAKPIVPAIFDQNISLPLDKGKTKPNPQNSAKSSLNYWWSQKTGNSFEFLLSSEKRVVYNFDLLPFSNIGKPEQEQQYLLNTQQNRKWFGIQTQFLWFGSIVFHLALLFSFFKLPEIRSVFKLSLVLSYKFFNGFFVIVFSIYNLFKKYTTRATHVVKKILQFLNSSFPSGKGNSEKSFVSFQTNLSTSQELQKFAFSRKKCIQEKNFENLFFASILYSKPFQKVVSNTKQTKNLFFFDLNDSFKANMSKKKIFEFIVRISEFSFTLPDRNISLLLDEGKTNKQRKALRKNFSSEQGGKQNSFFSSQKKNVQNLSLPLSEDKNILNRESAEQTIESLFSFSSKITCFYSNYSKKTFSLWSKAKNKKNFLFFPLSFSSQNIEDKFSGNNVNSLLFTENQKLPIAFWSVASLPLAKKNQPFFLKTKTFLLNKGKNQLGLKNVKKLSTLEKSISHFALSVLFFGKSTTILTYSIVKGGSSISAKVFDLFEMLLFSIYKFLEKPAEIMIEWIALIFLIEWSSDIATFVPDGFDISLVKSSQKFLRPVRSGSIFLSFLSSRSDLLNSSIYNAFLPLAPVTFGNSVVFFGSSNLLSFVFQKRMFYFFENFSSVLTQPDMDIMVRQRKGMIFWDIWAEILLKAAEKYNVNIPSFVTLKEEQELFIERLLQDKNFLKNLQIEKSSAPFFVFQKKKESFHGEILQQNSLASFVENFLIKEVFELNFQFNKKQIDQFTVCSQILSSPFNFGLTSSNIAFDQQGTNPFFKYLLFNNLKNTNFLPFATFLPLAKKGQQAKELQILPSSLYLQDQKNENLDLRACNQYATYQGPETDLFVDIHPPKSLKHIHFFKYYEPAQYTLGSFICQIYSGIFSKQVAKNILVIGAPGTAKTLFIQALAGETEMKIITDNAYRYSMVQRGVAVGMKYLRDVFDALVLQTPCFFLMEHIHVIGSKRPLLMSDDENVKGVQSSFGLDQQEVHETNQMIYQFNRHSISDYRRPYKGDFSMGIPTNFFIQNFYSKFEKNSTSLFKNSQFSAGGVNLMDRNSPISPLPIDSIENSLLKIGFSQKENTDMQNLFRADNFKKNTFNFKSRLQIATEQIFAPPATSPFTILMMKEQKKLKPKKIVQETSWGGLSTDQMISYQKENSSVRAKVAALADITMNLSRGKLDMITDLLVIIDSVRSNRGFVVFGTTHLPSLLDPALRRPGRFDETISLAQSPNFLNRFEILKKNFENSLTTLDYLDSSIVTENFSELNLLNLITGTKLSLFHQYKYTSPKIAQFESNATVGWSEKQQQKNQNFLDKYRLKTFNQTKIVHWQSQKVISQINPSKALQSFLKSSFFNDLYVQMKTSSFSTNEKGAEQILKSQKKQQIFDSSPFGESQNIESSKYFLRNFKLLKYTFLPKGPSHVLSLAYSKIGIFLAKSNLANDPTAYIPLTLDTNLVSSTSNQNQQFFGNTFYGSQEQQKLQLMVFLSGKISEFFIQKTVKRSVSKETYKKTMNLKNGQNFSFVLENPFEFFDQKFSVFPLDFEQGQKTLLTKNQFYASSQNLNINESTEKFNTSMLHKNDLFWTTFGNDQSWRSATPFVSSILQKRFLFTKNLLLSKMLFFDNKNQRKSPPSPPASSILMPSKKYENYKRTENDFVQKARFSINEKIQMHQQQRFLKQLYNIPVQQYFRSEMIQNRKTFFSSSFQELAYLDSLTRRYSSSHFYHKKYLGLRHRFSNFNQWWNGFLPEHNTETTYFSDVDWRTMFTTSSQKKNKQSQLFEKLNNQTFEFTMDFPDAEQYYNPRNRRWYFNGKFDRRPFFAKGKKVVKNSQNSVSYWLTFDMNLQYEIYYHYLMQSFHETFQYFDKNREIFDAFAFHLLRKGFLKELDCLATISRFKNF